MAGFTKLFSSILTSSLWVESDGTLRVWIALLALTDSRGFAEGSVPGLASICRMSVPDTETALQKLSASDEYSRSPEFEGRRIEAREGGWQVLNYLKYREKGQAKDGSRAPDMRRYRERVTRYNEMSRGVTRRSRVTQKQKQITEQITDSVGAPPKTQLSPGEKHPPLSTSSTAADVVFQHWRDVMGKPKARLDVKRRKAIEGRLRDGYTPEDLCTAIDGCRRSTFHNGANVDGRKYLDLELICRDSKHVDQFLDIATNGEPRPMSKTTAHNLRALGMLDPDGPPALPEPEEPK